MSRNLNIWLLVVVVVCGASYWFGRGLLEDQTPQVSIPAPVERIAGKAGDVVGLMENPVEHPDAHPAEHPEVSLAVLNGTVEAGLASEFGRLLGRQGCLVERVGNAPHDHFAESLLVNRFMSEEQAVQLAATLGGIPVVREFDRRSRVDAVLILGADAERIRVGLEAASLR